MGKLFGTDGIRGKVNHYPMTSEIALAVGKALGTVFQNTGKKHKFVIGKDTRLSGYMIESALTAGICSTGCDVLLVGPMPTPAIAFLTRDLNADAGIVISASHNPAEDNGIKVFSADGLKLSDETEEKIEEIIFSGSFTVAAGNDVGKAFRVNDAQKKYMDSIKKISARLDGLKIVLDCANGAAYHVGPKIFSDLGAEVVAINNKPDGLNINLKCGATHPEIVAAAVKKEKADMGFAFDGDADRMIFCDETGQILDGDYVLAFCAMDMSEKKILQGNTLVVTDYSNLCVGEALKKAGIKVVRTQNGDRYVMDEMIKNGFNLGGEFSGHLIFRDCATTGDAIISSLQLLKVLQQKNMKASEVGKIMKKYPQIIVNVEVKEKKEIANMPGVAKAIELAEKKLGNNGRVFVRYSGTQNLCRIMVEGKDEKEIRDYAAVIAAEIKKVNV